MIAKLFIRISILCILAATGSAPLFASAASAKQANAFHFFPIQQKKFFVAISALYASLSDGGTDLTPFAETVSCTGTIVPATVNHCSSAVPAENYNTKLGFNWGFEASLGYYLSENHHYALITNFLDLSNQRTVTASVGDTGYLFNGLTQFGNVNQLASLGFTTFYTDSNAASTASIQYQRWNVVLEEPWNDLEDPSKIFDFHKIKGMMMVRVAKGVTGAYAGNLVWKYEVDNSPDITPGTDSMLYAANAFGVGPELGIVAHGKLTDRINISLSSDSAILVGYYNAHYRENAQAVHAISVGANTSTNYTNSENHPSVAWTPIIFDVQITLDTKLWESKKHHCTLKGSGGLGGEYILPTFTSNGVTELLGTPLSKFNNNLSVTYAMMGLSLNTD